jgi:DNA-binding MarR family transcriptional regulator
MSRDTLAIMGRGDGEARGSHEVPQDSGPGADTPRRAGEPGRAGEGGGHRPLRDEVDELVAGWRAERPDLDVAPLQVLSRVSRLARHLDRARTAAFAAHGLQTWEFDVLSALRRQGAPYQLSPGALLRATLVTSGTMTNRIDRLASAGLVSRRPDPADKRGVLVALTDRGRAAADAALADLLTSERQLLTGLDGGQRRELAALLRILLAPFDEVQAPDDAPA